jgi:hypothetical protein
MAREPGSSAPKVFISYRREETAGHAGRLYDAIVARFGESRVSMDVEFAPGIDFVERITEAVGSCDYLLVVIGPRWATLSQAGIQPRLADANDYVRLEVETALKRPDVNVIPVLVAGAKMPGPDDLPESLQKLTRQNAIELSDARWRYDVGRLIATLEGESPGPLPETAAPAPAPAGRGRLIAIAGGAAVVVIVVILAIAGVFSGGGGGGGSGGGDTSASSTTAGANVTPVGAEGAKVAFKDAYETKDLAALRKLLDPDVVLKKGRSTEFRGTDAVIAEFRKEFEAAGNGTLAFNFDENGSDRNEELSEVHGAYRITNNGVIKDQGNFGLLTLIIGSQTSIKELCYSCPDLTNPHGFLNA